MSLALAAPRPGQAALNSCSGPQSLDSGQRQRLGHRERSRDNKNAVSERLYRPSYKTSHVAETEGSNVVINQYSSLSGSMLVYTTRIPGSDSLIC